MRCTQIRLRAGPAPARSVAPGIVGLKLFPLAHQLLKEHPDPSDEDIRHYLAGNLCRCAAYPEIIEAVKRAAKA